VGVPADLQPLKEPLVEAVIDAYMAKKMTEGTDFEFDHGGCDEGEFRYHVPRFGIDTKAYVSYPGGQWRIDQWLDPDDEVDPGTHVGEITTFDATAVYAMVREAVEGWVDPWIACSDPNELTGTMRTLAKVVDELYVQDEVRIGDSTAGGEEGGTSVPVGDVQSAIADMRSYLSSLNGLAIDALENAYVNDVGLTISGQRAMAAVAALAVGGEAEAWSQAFGHLTDFFENATKDFASLAKSHGASGGGGSTALSVVSGVSGAASAATFAFPPAAATLGVISGLAGIGSLFWPSTTEVGHTNIALEGDDFDAMWESFKEGVRAVNSQIVEAEYSLAMMCRNVLEAFGEHPDSFSITSRGRSGVPQAGDNLPRFLQTDQDSAPIELYAGDDVRIVHSKLREVAGRIEHVGDHQRSVAGMLGGAGASSGWDRAYLQGSIIGWGPTGHHGDLESLVDSLTDLLLLESRTAHRVAEHCLQVSSGFRLTDEQVEATLDRLESRLGG
jgi:hypothetical protein